MFPLKQLKWHPCCVNKSSSVTLMSWLTVWRLPKTSNHIRAWLVFQTWLQQVYHWPVPLSHNLWNQHHYNRNRFRTSPTGWNRPRTWENLRNNGIAHETYCALFVSNRGIFLCKETVSVMLTWSAGKCTLVTAEETGEGLKMVRAIKTSVLRHRSTDTSNTSSLLKNESVVFSHPTRSQKDS